jgi:hypothetical protein
MLRHPFFYKYSLDIKPTTGRNTMPLWGKTDRPEDEPLWSDLLRNMDTAGREIIFVDNTEASLEVNRARGFNAPGWWAYYTSKQSDGVLRYRGQELLVAISQTAAAAGDQDDNLVAANIESVINIITQPTNQIVYLPIGMIMQVDNVSSADSDRVEGSYEIAFDGYSTSGDGVNATFLIEVDEDGAATVTVVDAGSGYEEGEIITVSDALLGNGGADDLTFEVSSVSTDSAEFTVVAETDPEGDLIYQWQRQTATGRTWSIIPGATDETLLVDEVTESLNGYKYRVRISSTEGALNVISDAATLTVISE